ncbi:hypothetical protein [Sagittula sp. S175]|uniref:hypothetical protein n=1 Tax=Sagittula sp. S175 TaxID=3415129 RepID=UPI003C7E9F19
MTNTLDGLQCGFRILLSCFLAYTAVEFLMMTAGETPRLVVTHPGHQWAGKMLAALMILTALWMAFGVHTRVMALLGTALFAGMALLLPGLERLTMHSVLSVGLFATLALPLICAGGGRFSLLRGGWRVPL